MPISPRSSSSRLSICQNLERVRKHIIIVGLCWCLGFSTVGFSDAPLLPTAGGGIRPSDQLQTRLVTQLTSGSLEKVDSLASTTLQIAGYSYSPEELTLAFGQYLQSTPSNNATTTQSQLLFRLDTALNHLAHDHAVQKAIESDPGFIYRRDLLVRRLTTEYFIHTRLLSDITLSEADIARYYQENTSEFATPELVEFRLVLTASRSDIDKAIAELAAGTAFADVAKKYSLHTSRLRDGKLSPVARGTLAPSIEEQAFELADGERSAMIESTDGFYVVERLRTIPAVVTPLEEARPTIYKKLSNSKRREILDTFYADLIKNADLNLIAPQD
jgi:hypothetical protein